MWVLGTLGALTVGFVVCGAQGWQDAFVGTWKVDPSKSTTIVRCCVPDADVVASQLAKQEWLIIDVAGKVEHITHEIVDADGSRRKSRDTATFNDGRWHQPHDVETGRPDGGIAMTIRTDPRTDLIVGKNSAGTFAGLILRRVSEDGKTMTMTRSGPDGKIKQILVLDKQ